MPYPKFDIGNMTEEECVELTTRLIREAGFDVQQIKDIIEDCYEKDDLAELAEGWFDPDAD